MKKRIKFIEQNCKRCGKTLVSACKSLMGMEKEKKEFGILCSACVSPGEKIEMVNIMGKSFIFSGTEGLNG